MYTQASSRSTWRFYLPAASLVGLWLCHAWLWPGPSADPAALIRDKPLSFPPACRELPDANLARQASLAAQRLRCYQPKRWTELVHALRLWQFADAGDDIPTSKGAMLSLVLDGDRGVRMFGVPCTVATNHGVEFFLQGGGRRQCEGHRDQTLSALARLGTPTDTVMRVQSYMMPVRRAVEASIANFSWDQELEWTATAWALYLPPQRAWRNKYGEQVSFDAIASKLAEAPLGAGSCHGMHKLYALAVLLAADKRTPILHAGVRQRALHRLQTAVDVLSRSQRPTGAWGSDWAGRKMTPPYPPTDNDDIQSITVTGHALEWLAFAPPDMDLGRISISGACRYAVGRLSAEPAQLLGQRYCPYIHAVIALKQWLPHGWGRPARPLGPSANWIDE